MVKIEVDMENREKLRRLHTATHIVNYCARQVLGNHVWQNGSNLKPEFGTLDITHYDNISIEQIHEIERLANETVFANKKVKIEEIDRTQAEQKYGFTLYQGGAIPMKKLRIIHIHESDIEACGGIHMEDTGGIGLIKIIDAQKIQDGIVRLKYAVRNYALNEIEQKEQIIDSLKKFYKVEQNVITKTSEKFFEEWKEQKKDIEKMKKELKKIHIKNIENSKDEEYKIEGNWDMGFLMEIFTSFIGKKNKFKLVSNNFIIATSGIKPDNFKKEIPKGKFSIYII